MKRVGGLRAERQGELVRPPELEPCPGQGVVGDGRARVALAKSAACAAILYVMTPVFTSSRFGKRPGRGKIFAAVLAEADAAGDIDWTVSIDSTINRAHQHATTLPRTTGGADESHESARRAG